MSENTEPTMAEMWDKLSPHDREVLSRVCCIPEAQLALTRVSNVMLRLLGALGHVTYEEQRRKEEAAKQAIAEAKIKEHMYQMQQSLAGSAPDVQDASKQIKQVLELARAAHAIGDTGRARVYEEMAKRLIESKSIPAADSSYKRLLGGATARW